MQPDCTEDLDEYETKLLAGWEDVYRKSQLTMWLLLALKAGPKHMALIKQFVADLTNQTVTPDDKSMYRALRRLHEGELLSFKSVASDNGPDLKVYSLTNTGHKVLQAFLERNIIKVFFDNTTQQLIKET